MLVVVVVVGEAVVGKKGTVGAARARALAGSGPPPGRPNPHAPHPQLVDGPPSPSASPAAPASSAPSGGGTA